MKNRNLIEENVISSQYIINWNNRQFGPIDERNVWEYFLLREIQIDDYVYDVVKKEWLLVGEVPMVKESSFIGPNSANLKKIYLIYEESFIDSNIELLVLTSEQVKKLIRDKKINLFQYAFSFEHGSWKCLIDYEDFKELIPPKPLIQPDFLKQEKEQGFERKFKRGSFYSTAKIYFKGITIGGICTTIGAGGCFVESKNQLVDVSDKVEIDIFSDLVGLELKCKAEVVGKITKKISGLCLKFLNTDDEFRKNINKIVEERLIQE